MTINVVICSKETELMILEEKIYTIPVNEAFAKKDGCPFCRLKRELEDMERDLIMGASMMEPDIRIKTNKLGFCKKHYTKMFEMNNRLSLALMLESHLMEIRPQTVIYKNSLLGKDNSKKACENMQKLSKSCYICEKTEEKFSKMLLCAVLLWEGTREFRDICAEQPYFCIEHAAAYVEIAKLKLDKKLFAQFAESISKVQETYLESLNDDVSWFCKKFDYRYDNEPWGNSKDSVERAIKLLSGDY